MARPLPLQSIHHVELVVGNARQAAYYYRKAFGFSQVAYQGPETGVRDRASYVVQQGYIRLVLTSPLGPEGPLAEHLSLHGDGVRDIAFEVDDAPGVFAAVAARGARPEAPPRPVSDGGGAVQIASIRAYGDVTHTFVERGEYEGPFLPGFEPAPIAEPGVGLKRIDHLVANVADGEMDHWARWYEQMFGFHQFMSFDDKDISTTFSALRSKVMSSPTGSIKLPINEPAEGLKRSQIQEYLDAYRAPGVQHLAFHTPDVVATVTDLRRRGVEFLHVPEAYYESLWDRVGEIKEDRDTIAELGVLVDRDDEGYLLQLFTRPVQDRPTLFFEIIQRHGAQGFGKGNFKALFESIEREQARRGNL